jgi:hypothetical protein
MTDPAIENLNLLDTEYAVLVAQGRDPIREAKEREIYAQIAAYERNPGDSSAKARFLSLLGNPAVNDEQFGILIRACGYLVAEDDRGQQQSG